MGDDRYAYHYPTGPIAGTDTSETWVRGKVVGGSTTINGMIYSRGARPDFEALAKHTGSRYWAWDNFQAAYRAMEDHELGPSPTRGAGGRFRVSATGTGDELAGRLFAAGEMLGWTRVDDINDSDDERIGYTPSAVRDGLRSTASGAFLRPALQAGVTLATGVRAERILISQGRAVGVTGSRGTSAVEFRARKEIILACGTIESPLLLERSGIGRPDLLQRLGIEPRVASPNVGERVIEQHMTLLQVRFDRRLGVAEELSAAVSPGLHPEAYLGSRRGVLATSGYDFTFYAKSQPDNPRPDLVGTAAAFTIDPTAGGFTPAAHSGMLIAMYQIRPETTSAVHSSAPGPGAPPVITPRYFETETDQRAASRILGCIREFIGSGPLAEIVAGEDFPASAVGSDPASALAYARHHGGTVFHGVGSCAMGPASDDVLDAELRVRGVNGLRVIDASALPFQVSANTAAPAMALAWLAADLLD
jgi:choline dehydrogenase-like flavoprotein